MTDMPLVSGKPRDQYTSAGLWEAGIEPIPMVKTRPEGCLTGFSFAMLREKLKNGLGPVFQGVFYFVEELVGDGAIYDAVVVA